MTLEIWDEMPHVFQAFAGLLPEADQAVARIGSWLSRHICEGVEHVAADHGIESLGRLEQPRPHPGVVGPDVAGA